MILDVPGQASLHLPAVLLHNLRTLHRPCADPWLDQLPELLAEIAAELDASLDPLLPELSYHVVVFARSRRLGDIVIKCTVPNPEFSQETRGTVAMADAGGPRVLMTDLERGYVVMERVSPGTPIDGNMPTLDSDFAITELVASLSLALSWRVDVDSWRGKLPDIRRWTQALDAVDRRSPLWAHHAADVVHAIALRDRYLAKNADSHVFLHGDLHHANVLRGEGDRWVAIDGKGVIGPAAFEFGAFAYNPLGVWSHPRLPELLRQRVAIWSRVTGIPETELRDWGFIAAVLSACWTAEDGGENWRGEMLIAAVLRDLPGTPTARLDMRDEHGEMG